jgi:phosphatidate cytidylyltransferase
MSELQKRVVTGVGLLILIFFIGYINNYYLMWSFLGLVTVLAVSEATKLFQLDSPKIATVLTIIIWIATLFYSSFLELIFVALVIFLSYSAYNREFSPKNGLFLIYPLVPMLFILMLYISFGIESLLWLLIIVALTDSFAYFVGRKFGKTQFCPTSPKKTMEGLYGGVIIATIVGSYIGVTLFEYSTVTIILSTFLVSISSIFGDLFESYLKREANIKDSGNILPGHGGVLDRVDGYLFSAIFMYVILNSGVA